MAYRNTVQFQVTGDLALFSDPVTRTGGEKSSYQVPTYEALKGILHSAYWKPTIVWVVRRVRIINPVQTCSKGIRTRKYSGGNDLSIYTYLSDVCYQVEAHFEWNENRPELATDRDEHKHHNIARRMIARGGRRDIFLGARECQGYIAPCEFGSGKGFYDGIPELSLGNMFHGFTYPDEAVLPEEKGVLSARFFKPVMKNGVIDFPRPEECPQRRVLREGGIKAFGEGNFAGLNEFESGELL